MSRQVVWSYRSKSNQGFFSHIGSGAQRLPNGNTLICAMTEGHFFEVTPEAELVWEYINPVTRDGALKVLPDSLPMTNAVFRAYRYCADHPALQGKDLTPKGTITDRYAQGLDRDLAPRRPPQGDRGPKQGGGRGARGGAQGGPRPPGDRSPDGRPAGADRRGPGAGQGRWRHPVVLALDANGDGEISAGEIAGGAAALKKLDTDGDGRVGREEMRPADADRRPPN